MPQTSLMLTQFIPQRREEVFRYFTTPKLLEQWSYPDGMSLKVGQFDAAVGGQYRFEHSAPSGVFVCTGYLKEFVRAERLVYVDTVVDPSGKRILENAECTVNFRDRAGGTEVSVAQVGLKDEASRRECEDSWRQCLARLASVVEKGPGQKSRSDDYGISEAAP